MTAARRITAESGGERRKKITHAYLTLQHVDGRWEAVSPITRRCPNCGYGWYFLGRVPETWVCYGCYRSVTEGADG